MTAGNAISNCTAVILFFCCTSCETTNKDLGTSCETTNKDLGMSYEITDDVRQDILQIIDNYPKAFEIGDPMLWESLFWLDDPDFSVIENDKPHLMGREYIDYITGLIRTRGNQPPGPKWYETQLHLLSHDTVYTTSLRDETFPHGIMKTSRITLVFMNKAGEWRIIHGHFSAVPE